MRGGVLYDDPFRGGAERGRPMLAPSLIINSGKKEGEVSLPLLVALKRGLMRFSHMVFEIAEQANQEPYDQRVKER